jgi:glycosyl transferase family 25
MSILKNIGIEGIYIVHAKNGYELHEQRINQLFGKLQLSHEFVTDGDPSHFSTELLDNYFSHDIKLKQGILSCTLNHIYSYERIVKNQNKYALVFENDPFFLGNFVNDITRIVNEAESRQLKNFIISLENTCMKFPSYWDTEKGKYLYEANAGRAAGAYLIDFEAAKNIIDDLKTNKCHTVIDWWHNSLIERNVIRMFWAHPPLVEQGSHNGQLNSTISSKSKSYTRRIRWNLQKVYKYYIKRLFKEKRIISTNN